MPTDEYEFDRNQSPIFMVQVSLAAPNDAERFLTVLRDFAARYDIPAMEGLIGPDRRLLPGPFLSKNFLIAPLVCDRFPTGNYAQARLELRRRSFPKDQFQSMAAEFVGAMRTEFGSQVRVAAPGFK